MSRMTMPYAGETKPRARAAQDLLTTVTNDKMMPGHLLEYRCPKSAIVNQWLVVGICGAAAGQQDLVEVMPISLSLGTDKDDNTQARVVVPRQMTECLTVIVPGVRPTAPETSTDGTTRRVGAAAMALFQFFTSEGRGVMRNFHITRPSFWDYERCMELVQAGLMVKVPSPDWLPPEDVIFKATVIPKGRNAVAETGETQ